MAKLMVVFHVSANAPEKNSVARSKLISANLQRTVIFLFIVNVITSIFMYEGYCTLKCNVVWSGNCRTFQRYLPSPPSNER